MASSITIKHILILLKSDHTMETSISLSVVLLTSILGFITTKGTLATAIGETVREERDLTSTDGHGRLATEPAADVITLDDLHSTTIPATTTVVINGNFLLAKPA